MKNRKEKIRMLKELQKGERLVKDLTLVPPKIFFKREELDYFTESGTQNKYNVKDVDELQSLFPNTPLIVYIINRGKAIPPDSPECIKSISITGKP